MRLNIVITYERPTLNSKLKIFELKIFETEFLLA